MHELQPYGLTQRVIEQFEPHAARGLVLARVTAEHRGLWAVQTARGEIWAQVTGRVRHDASGDADLPATGDWVALELLEGETRGIVRAVLPRASKLSRKAAGARTDEQVLAANVDTVFLVSGLDGDFNVRRLERYLAMVWDGGANPVVVLTKADLCDVPLDAVTEAGSAAPGVPVVVTSAVTRQGIEQLRGWLDGHATVALLGSSGVGKSTLVNAIAGTELMDTAATRRDGRGRHTTTHRELLVLPDGGLLLDTPGMRELSLWDGDGVSASFEDVEETASRCRFGDCAHATEPGCAVRAALQDGTLDGGRYEAWLKLGRELAFLERRQDQRASNESKRRWKAITKSHRQRSKLEGR